MVVKIIGRPGIASHLSKCSQERILVHPFKDPLDLATSITVLSAETSHVGTSTRRHNHLETIQPFTPVQHSLLEGAAGILDQETPELEKTLFGGVFRARVEMA